MASKKETKLSLELSKKREEILEDFESARHYHEPFHKKWEEFRKLFELNHIKDGKRKGRANYFLPSMFQKIQEINAKYYAAIFDQIPFIQCIPVLTKLDESIREIVRERARANESLISHQIEHGDHDTTIMESFDGFSLFGNIVYGLGWDTEFYEKAVPRIEKNGVKVEDIELDIITDDIILEDISLFEFFPDPDAKSLNNPHKVPARFIIRRKEMHWFDVVEKLQAKVWKPPLGNKITEGDVVMSADRQHAKPKTKNYRNPYPNGNPQHKTKPKTKWQNNAK